MKDYNVDPLMEYIKDLLALVDAAVSVGVNELKIYKKKLSYLKVMLRNMKCIGPCVRSYEGDQGGRNKDFRGYLINFLLVWEQVSKMNDERLEVLMTMYKSLQEKLLQINKIKEEYSRRATIEVLLTATLAVLAILAKSDSLAQNKWILGIIHYIALIIMLVSISIFLLHAVVRINYLYDYTRYILASLRIEKDIRELIKKKCLFNGEIMTENYLLEELNFIIGGSILPAIWAPLYLFFLSFILLTFYKAVATEKVVRDSSLQLSFQLPSFNEVYIFLIVMALALAIISLIMSHQVKSRNCDKAATFIIGTTIIGIMLGFILSYLKLLPVEWLPPYLVNIIQLSIASIALTYILIWFLTSLLYRRVQKLFKIIERTYEGEQLKRRQTNLILKIIMCLLMLETVEVKEEELLDFKELVGWLDQPRWT